MNTVHNPGFRARGKRGDDGLRKWSIDPVLPPSSGEMLYEDLPPVVAAIEDCRVLQGGNEVNVYDDEELGVQAIEVVGRRVALIFPCSSILRHLCMHIKILDKFASFEIEIVDDTSRYRQIDVSNNRSLVTIDGDRASLPLQAGGSGGWQYINMDLEHIVRVAFGSGYLTTCQITLHPSLWVAKLFFQDKRYSDFELPEYLRATGKQEL